MLSRAGTKRFGQRPQQRQRPLVVQFQLLGALLQTGQVEQIVDHCQQPLRVVAGIDQQLELLRLQWTGGLLEQQVQRQPDASERCFQLVADGGHEIALHFIEQTEPRHVLQQHRGADCRAAGVANRQDTGQERADRVAGPQHDGLVETFGQILALLAQGVGERLPQRRGWLPLRGRVLVSRRRQHAQQPAGHPIGQFDALLPVNHEHRIGQGIDCRLGRLLSERQFRIGRFTQLAKLAGHRVEASRQIAEFIVRADGHQLIEVAGADRPRRFGHGADRKANCADRAGHQQHRQPDAGGQTDAVAEQRRIGGAARLSINVLHPILVELDDLIGRRLDLLGQGGEAHDAGLTEVEPLALSARRGEERIPALAILVRLLGERGDQFGLAGNSDIVLFPDEVLVVGVPRRSILVGSFRVVVGEGQQERAVDPPQRLVQALHVDDRVVVLAQDVPHAMAELKNQKRPRAP